MRVLLTAQVGRSVTSDHAVAVDADDEDTAVAKAMRSGYSRERTLCGRTAEARGRLFDPQSRRACGGCVRRME